MGVAAQLDQGGNEKFLAAMLAMTVFVALPMGLWLQEVPQFPAGASTGTVPSKLLTMLAGGIAGIATSLAINTVRRAVERQKKVAKEFEESVRRYAESHPSDISWQDASKRQFELALERQVGPLMRFVMASSRLVIFVTWKALGVVALFVWTVVVFAGLGYKVERSYGSRLCAGGRFVADVDGDNLLLKRFDAKTGEILSLIKVVEIKGVDLDTCYPRLVGARGLVLLF